MTDIIPDTAPITSAPHGLIINTDTVPIATPPASVAFWMWNYMQSTRTAVSKVQYNELLYLLSSPKKSNKNVNSPFPFPHFGNFLTKSQISL